MNAQLIDPSQIEPAAEALGRAFFDDLLQSYILPVDEERRQLSPPLFRALIVYGHMLGHVLTTPGQPLGAAVWMRPGETDMTEEGMEKAGFGELPGILGQAAFDRFVNFFAHIEPYHHRGAPPQHWYLAVIGVDPPHQGRGVGAGLIRPVLARADEAGIACYLETTQPKNVPLYQHLGFRTLVEEVEPTSGLRFWTFLREPHGGNRSEGGLSDG